MIHITSGSQLDSFISNRVDLLLSTRNLKELIETTPSLIEIDLDPTTLQQIVYSARRSLRTELEKQLIAKLKLPKRILFEYAETVAKK